MIDYKRGNPEHTEGRIKVLVRDGNSFAGCRAIPLAISKDGLEAVALIINGPLWGEVAVVREEHRDQWPRHVGPCPKVPEGFTITPNVLPQEAAEDDPVRQAGR